MEANARIKDGCLYVKRPRGWTRQHCKHGFYDCDDGCPLFGEIERNSLVATLTICENQKFLIATATIKEE